MDAFDRGAFSSRPMSKQCCHRHGKTCGINYLFSSNGDDSIGPCSAERRRVESGLGLSSCIEIEAFGARGREILWQTEETGKYSILWMFFCAGYEAKGRSVGLGP